jgi:5-methylcytosine-specific restriction enzyme subunit McrC
MIPVRNLYYLLSYAWDYVRPEDAAMVTQADLGSVPDLLAHVLSRGVARLISRGLDRSYDRESAALRSVRGKIDPWLTHSTGLAAASMIYCHYDELSVDVLQNRLLKGTLRDVLQLRDLDPGVRKDVELVFRKVEGIRVTRIEPRAFGSVQVHRNNKAYAFLLGICRLLQEGLSVDSRSGRVRFAGIGDERMSAIFEAFIRGFYARELEGWRVTRPRLQWHAAERVALSESLIPGMQTDVVLMSADRRVILDAKYYAKSFQERYGRKSVHSGNLYQIVA